MDRNEIFKTFSEAMGADRYRITSKLDAPGEDMTPEQINKQHFTFGKVRGAGEAENVQIEQTKG